MEPGMDLVRTAGRTKEKSGEASGSSGNDGQRSDGIGVTRILKRFGQKPFAPALVALVVMFIVVGVVNSASRTYGGASLLLSSFVGLAAATVAQMWVIGLGDIDLGIGKFVGLVNAILCTVVIRDGVVGWLAVIGCVLIYPVMGLVIYERRAPAIVVTLGASFVWLGAALLLLPSPGGVAPSWLVSAVDYRFPVVPLPIVVIAVIAVAAWWLLTRSRLGRYVRAVGSDPRGARRSGLNVRRGVVVGYALAGVFAVFAGLALTGITTSGDVSVGAGYTLSTIAAVILGGGEFLGGVVNGVGAVVGAVVVGLVGSVLAFVNVSSDWDFAVEGGLLISFVALRLLLKNSTTVD